MPVSKRSPKRRKSFRKKFPPKPQGKKARTIQRQFQEFMRKDLIRMKNQEMMDKMYSGEFSEAIQQILAEEEE